MTTNRSGFVHGMPGDEYHGGPEISYSRLKKVARSPAHYRWNKDHPKPSSSAMDIGSAVDCLLFDGRIEFDKQFTTPPLTPDDLPDWCVLAPSSARKADKESRAAIRADGFVPIKESSFDLTGLKLNTKCGKAWRDRVSARVISHHEHHQVQECVNAIRCYPLAAELLAGALYQVSMFWTDQEFGVACRGRPDILGPHHGYTDLKTTNDVRFFGNAIDTFKLHWQVAMYLDGMPELGWAGAMDAQWIIAEPEPPYAVEVTPPISPTLIELGREEYREALATYARCLKDGQWPASSYKLREYDLPNWRYNR
jgi:hypothetical protein